MLAPLPRRCCGPAARPTSRRPNLLTLAPAGRREVGQPLAPEGVPRRGVPRAVRERLRRGRAARPLPRAQAARCTSWRCAPAGTACTPRSASPSPSTTASRRPSPRATSRCAPGRSTARSTSSRCSGLDAPPAGALALVLHSHMPYVEGFGTWPFGEEWLWEAVACVYLPLLDVLDGAPVTLGLTPVLCDQLEAMRGEAGERYLALPARDPRADPRRGRRRAGRHRRARARRRGAPRGGRLQRARTRASSAAAATCSAAFARSTAWSCGPRRATHAVLPLLATDAGRAAAGGHGHRARTCAASAAGAAASGCPSAPTRPGLERDLADHGVRAFCVDQTDASGRASTTSTPGRDRRRAAWPCRSTGRRCELVWSDEHGYPAHGTYRDYHGRTRPRPEALEQRRRALRPRRRARRSPATHARDFVRARGSRRLRGRRPALLRARHRAARALVVRGPRLAARRARGGASAQGARAGHASPRALERAEPAARGRWPRRPGARPRTSSTWDSPARGGAGLRRPRGASCAPSRPRPAPRRRDAALERAARELLALQSSDWAFMVTRELAADYPLRAHAAGTRGRWTPRWPL